MKYFDLSNAQKLILYFDIPNLNDDVFFLNFRKYYDISDIGYLQKAVNIICTTNLNIRFKNVNDTMCQFYVKEDNNDKFELLEFTSTNEEDLDDLIYNFLTNDTLESIIDSPLYKIGIVKTSTKAILIGVFHHSLVDGTSLFTIFPKRIEECITSLKNNETPYEDSELNYRTYVEREKDYLKSNEFQKDKEYWINTLNGYEQDWYYFENLDLGTYELSIDEKLNKKLQRLSTVQNTIISPFILAFSVISLYIARCKESKDIVWNTSVSGRYFGEDINQILGMFTNIIPLRIDYKGNYTFEDYLIYCKNILKEGLNHGKIQNNQYEKELINKNINPNCLSMYSIVSNSTSYDAEYITLQKQSEFPFHIRVNKNYDDQKGLQSLFIEYNRNCFSSNQINDIFSGINHVLEQVAMDSSKRCDEYDVEVNEFFNAETFFNNIVKSFNKPSLIVPDLEDNTSVKIFDDEEFIIDSDITKDILKYCQNENLSLNVFFYSVLLFNLTRYTFSDKILLSTSNIRNVGDNKYLNKYNQLALGYTFDTDKSIIEYQNDVKQYLDTLTKYSFYPLMNNESLDFKPEMLVNYKEISKNEKYVDLNKYYNQLNHDINLDQFKLIFTFIYEDDDLRFIVRYDTSLYSKELMTKFVDSMKYLISRFLSDKGMNLTILQNNTNNN